MPANELFFRVNNGNWIDAYTNYGISLDDTAMSKIMTPAPNKSPVENKSDLEHGKRVVRSTSGVKKDERNLSLTLNMTASSMATFLTNYGKFCTEILDKGFFDMYVSHQDYTENNQTKHVIYRLTYIDCNQYREFMFGIGKYTLNVNEPDPTNRGMTSSW